MKVLAAPRMERCIGCHLRSLAGARCGLTPSTATFQERPLLSTLPETFPEYGGDGGKTSAERKRQLQADFMAARLSGAQQRGIKTVIETAGSVAWKLIGRLIGFGTNAVNLIIKLIIQ